MPTKTQKLYVQLIRESLTKPGFDAGKLSGLLRDRKVGEAGDYLKGFGLDFERLGLDSEQREGIRASASRSQTRRTLGLLESPWLAPFWTMMGVGLGGGGLKEGRPGEVLLPETFRRKAEDLFEKVLAENSSLFLDRKYEPLIFRVKLGDEKAWQLLGELSRDPDSTVRGNVAASLGKIAGPEALAMLLEMREDPNMDVRMMVARAIGKIGASRALEPLREMRGDTANCVRSNVARAIGEIGGPEALAMLREMRGDAAELVRASVAEALAIRPGREALEMLCEMKGDPAPEVRRTIAQLLGNLGGPEALAILREMRGDPALFVCQAVDRALAKIGLSEAWGIPFDRMSDPEGEVLIDGVPYAKARALELVREVRRSPHGDVRMQVASALGQIGGSEALEMLGKMKGDPFELVRKSVAIALSEIGGERALEILASMDVHSIPLWALHQLLDSSTARYSSEPTVSPSPEARLTQEIRLRVARQVRREEINVARHGFHNGGNHRSLRQSPRGMDLASLREIKVGDPILGRLREINGVLLGEEHHFPQQGKVVLAIDPSLLAGENRENVAAVAGTLSEVSLLQRDSIALLIGTGQTRSFLAPREAKTTQSVVGRVLGHGNLNSASPVRLLDDPLLRQNLPSGSIVYLLGNYFAEENIAGLQRIFDGRRALGITVVPIQVGGRVLDSRHQVNFEGRKYPVHPAYSEGRTLAKAESRRSEVEALLKRNGGFALRDFSTASTVDVVDDLLRQRQQAPGARDSHVKLEAQLLSEHEGIKIRSQPHPSDIFARMHQIVEQENFPELKRLVDEAKGKGWSVVMDWVDRMYALVARTSLEREGRYDLFRAEN
ncbi:MAG: HEAT repeat domain-containing protein, partial [Deltaproteobacteria bacterium]|nr:HEAT repeat domain-containing protein [Deltaproteobacteria bacterium]